jgi:hypothetical protein
MQIIFATRLISVWMSATIILMGVVLSGEPDDLKFYRFGPHPDLVIIGFIIDQIYKYIILLIFCACNTVIRNINHNVIMPWITLTIQDNSDTGMEQRTTITSKVAYEVSIVSTIYTWFDWFIYINLLLSQIDLLLVEIATDVIVTTIITYMYMNTT